MSNGQQLWKNLKQYHNFYKNGSESSKHSHFSESIKVNPCGLNLYAGKPMPKSLFLLHIKEWLKTRNGIKCHAGVVSSLESGPCCFS